MVVYIGEEDGTMLEELDNQWSNSVTMLNHCLQFLIAKVALLQLLLYLM